MANAYYRTSRTGGGATALDGIDGTGLSDNDFALVLNSAMESLLAYRLDSDAGLTESDPAIIAPDANAGTKRWRLIQNPGEYYVNYGATDQGVDSADFSLKDLLVAIGTTKKATVIFKHWPEAGNTTTYTVSTTYDASSYTNVTFKFENGAILSVGNGVTLTLPHPYAICAWPDQQIFSWTGTGAIRFAKSGAFHPAWWGAKGDATTDDSAALQACIDSYKALMTTLVTPTYGYDENQAPPFEMIGGRIYLVNTSLNTGGSTTSCLRNWHGNGCTILGKTTDEPVIVNTGGHIWYWKDLTIIGDAVSVPNCGIFLSRNSDGDGAGSGHFSNVFVRGAFTYAPLYNVASELNRYENCWFWADSGQSSAMLLNTNTRSITPAVGGTPFAGTTTSLTQTFEDCEFYTADQTAGVLTNHSALEIDGFDSVKIYSSEFNTTYGAHTGSGTTCNRPMVLLRGTAKNISNLLIKGSLFHNQYLYGIELRDAIIFGEATITGNFWGTTPTATGNNQDNDSWQFYASGAGQLNACKIDAPNIYLGTALTDAQNHCVFDLSNTSYRDTGGQHYFELARYFDGELFCDTVDNITLSATESDLNAVIHYVDTGLVVPHRGQYRNHNTSTIDTAITADLHSYTIPAGLWKPHTSWLIRAKGRFNEANGNKAVNLYIGSQAYAICPAANYANNTQWVCEVHLTTTGAATQLGIGKTYTHVIGSTTLTYTWLDSVMLPAQDSTAAITVKWEGILSHGDDSINQAFSQISPY